MSKSIRGNLGTFSLPDLLQWLEISRHSGRVTLTKGRTRRSIDLQGGSIVFVSSTRRDERLGFYLAQERILPRHVLFSALAENALTGKNLTRVILDRGLLSREQLAAAVEALAVRILLDLFRWEDAPFDFDPTVPTEDILRVQLSLRGQILAMQGAKSLDDRPRSTAKEPGESTAAFKAEAALEPDAVAGTYWSILERCAPKDGSPEAGRELFFGFQRFAVELKHRILRPHRPAPIWDDTASLLKRALREGAPEEQLVQIPALDPFLTMNLIGFANALRLGPKGACGTAWKAARTVGEDALRLFLDLSSRPEAPKTPSGHKLDRVIRTSAIGAAVAASRIAPSLGFDPELAYTLGLIEPLASYEPLQALLAAHFAPGAFRAEVLGEFRPLYGRALAEELSLPDEHAQILGATGVVSAKSPAAERLIYLAKRMVPAEGIGCEFTTEDPELVERSTSLASDPVLLEEIKRDTARFHEILGL